MATQCDVCVVECTTCQQTRYLEEAGPVTSFSVTDNSVRFCMFSLAHTALNTALFDKDVLCRLCESQLLSYCTSSVAVVTKSCTVKYYDYLTMEVLLCSLGVNVCMLLHCLLSCVVDRGQVVTVNFCLHEVAFHKGLMWHWHSCQWSLFGNAVSL